MIQRLGLDSNTFETLNFLSIFHWQIELNVGNKLSAQFA